MNQPIVNSSEVNAGQSQGAAAIAFLSQDLMFYSQIHSAAKSSGRECVMVKNPEDLTKRAMPERLRWVIVDLFELKRPVSEICEGVRSFCSNALLIGFGPHVDRDDLNAARASNFDRVMTRSEFHRALPTLFRE